MGILAKNDQEAIRNKSKLIESKSPEKTLIKNK